MHGGMVVVGLSTGDVFIEDIQVRVPHKVAVFIPAEKVLRSKDLYRALGQQKVFPLDGGSGISFESTSAVSDEKDTRIRELEEENRALRAELAEQKNADVRHLMTALQQNLADIQAGMGRLESRTVAVPTSFGGGAIGAPIKVEIDVPTFLPSEIKPKDAEAQIRIEKQVSEGASLAEAGNKLKELRRKSGG